ncbi:hypothetical protein CCHOA_06915 [Corynebacterium choanae]|uniref:Uncharacterized protein n=1 Tax=Corynebacterium choanae TaxID=1862358 RepID=A0A3G6J6P5_9CORY|nr:hypothetical protein CCHOA_06915 [Corynebacterium choanae]
MANAAGGSRTARILTTTNVFSCGQNGMIFAAAWIPPYFGGILRDLASWRNTVTDISGFANRSALPDCDHVANASTGWQRSLPVDPSTLQGCRCGMLCDTVARKAAQQDSLPPTRAHGGTKEVPPTV